MKKTMFFALAALLITVPACGQNKEKSDAPEAVTSAFSKKFPNAQKVKWERENDQEWEAEFKMNGKEYSANFSNSGAWKETEHELKKGEIPTDIKAILDKNFSDYEIEEAELAEKENGTYYEFVIEIGEEEFDVTIDPQGNVTKEQIKDDDED